jgi:hypothetical protein
VAYLSHCSASGFVALVQHSRNGGTAPLGFGAVRHRGLAVEYPASAAIRCFDGNVAKGTRLRETDVRRFPNLRSGRKAGASFNSASFVFKSGAKSVRLLYRWLAEAIRRADRTIGTFGDGAMPPSLTGFESGKAVAVPFLAANAMMDNE